MISILNFLLSLFTYSAGPKKAVAEVESGGSVFDEDDESDDTEGEETADSGLATDFDTEGDGEDLGAPVGDFTGEVESEEGESEDVSESEGDGASEGEVAYDGAAVALKEALRAKFQAQGATKKEADIAFEDLDLASEFPDLNEDDVGLISKVAAKIAKQYIRQYHTKQIQPGLTKQREAYLDARLANQVTEFNRKQPGALQDPVIQEKVALLYEEFYSEFGKEVAAGEITVEQYYTMAGGRGVKAAKAAKAGIVKKAAEAQKRNANKAQNTPGSVAKISPGRSRKPKDTSIDETFRNIQQRNFQPFIIR